MDDTRGWQQQSMPQCKCRQDLPNWAKAEWLTTSQLWKGQVHLILGDDK